MQPSVWQSAAGSISRRRSSFRPLLIVNRIMATFASRPAGGSLPQSKGATGIIMLGWSTAFVVSLLAQLKLLAHDWLTPDR